MAPTVAQVAADVGGGHLMYYNTYYYLHDSATRCETIVKRMAKHKCNVV